MLEVKVLGPGCPNCLKLEALCREVVAESNLEADIEKVTKPDDIWQYGIMLTQIGRASWRERV